jgi:hypothetical protein
MNKFGRIFSFVQAPLIQKAFLCKLFCFEERLFNNSTAEKRLVSAPKPLVKFFFGPSFQDC